MATLNMLPVFTMALLTATGSQALFTVTSSPETQKPWSLTDMISGRLTSFRQKQEAMLAASPPPPEPGLASPLGSFPETAEFLPLSQQTQFDPQQQFSLVEAAIGSMGGGHLLPSIPKTANISLDLGVMSQPNMTTPSPDVTQSPPLTTGPTFLVSQPDTAAKLQSQSFQSLPALGIQLLKVEQAPAPVRPHTAAKPQLPASLVMQSQPKLPLPALASATQHKQPLVQLSGSTGSLQQQSSSLAALLESLGIKTLLASPTPAATALAPAFKLQPQQKSFVPAKASPPSAAASILTALASSAAQTAEIAAAKLAQASRLNNERRLAVAAREEHCPADWYFGTVKYGDIPQYCGISHAPCPQGSTCFQLNKVCCYTNERVAAMDSGLRMNQLVPNQSSMSAQALRQIAMEETCPSDMYFGVLQHSDIIQRCGPLQPCPMGTTCFQLNKVCCFTDEKLAALDTNLQRIALTVGQNSMQIINTQSLLNIPAGLSL